VTITLVILLTITGVLLMVYYVPATNEAYASMQDLEYAIVLGSFVRAMHRWSAHGMVVVAVLHLTRVGAMSAYRCRERNWFYGLILLLLTLGLAFTGYLLPWDHLSYWAVRVSASMMDNVPIIGGWIKRLFLGGNEIGQATLTRFYMLHIALLPGLMFLFLALHLWRIRKDGGLAVSPAICPKESPAITVPIWPHLILREVVVALVTTAVFCLLAGWFSAPLGAPPDFHIPSNPEKSPWYFLGIQEMVSYSALVGGVLFPAVFFAGLVVLPLVDNENQGLGQWFANSLGRKVVLVSVVISLVACISSEALFLADASLISDWFNPATAMLALALSTAWVAGWATGSRKIGCLSGIAVLTVALAVFTLMGLCRGPNWVFYWPWQEWPIVF
jgi:quinol-cytochrome oxidoreductase complex cytochrome b subunit